MNASMGSIALCLTILATGPFLAASDEKIFEHLVALKSETLSPRATPAQVSKLSEEALTKQGLIYLGTISRKEITGTYWGKEERPSTVPTRDVTTKLCREAAENGGDLIVLQADNTTYTSSIRKNGRALTWRRESRSETYQYRLRTGDPGTRATRTVYYNVPTSWETIEGTQYTVWSGGTLWRNDPELAKRLAEKAKAVSQVRLRLQDSASESERQAALLLQEAAQQSTPAEPLVNLHDLVRGNQVEKVKALLATGADVNKPDDTGRTALHVAALSNARAVAELLLAKGANPNAKDKDGKTPLALALQSKNTALIQLLRMHGAK